MPAPLPRLSFGLIEGRPVFMDETDDSYFLLDGWAEEEFLQRKARRSTSCSAELRETLGADPDSIPLARSPRPAASIARPLLRSSRPAIADVLKTAHIVFETRTWIARRPIARILAAIEHRAAGEVAPAQAGQLDAAARTFLAARRLVPVRNNCLLDSLSLVRWLLTGGSPAVLVFGVKLHPFAAHCWVQSGELLLNDRLETVSRFEPVRVIQCSSATP